VPAFKLLVSDLEILRSKSPQLTPICAQHNFEHKIWGGLRSRSAAIVTFGHTCWPSLRANAPVLERPLSPLEFTCSTSAWRQQLSPQILNKFRRGIEEGFEETFTSELVEQINKKGESGAEPPH